MYMQVLAEYYADMQAEVTAAYDAWMLNTTDNGKKRAYDRKKGAYDQEKEFFLEDLTVVNVYFKELGIIHYTRDELYGIIDVIGEAFALPFEIQPVLHIQLLSSCVRWHHRALHGLQPAQWG